MNPIHLELTAELFEAFGSLYPGTRKPLSPLQPFGPSSPNSDQKFIQEGILDSQKHVKEPFISLLTNLAKTDVHLELSWDHSGEQKSLSIYSNRRVYSSNLYAPTFVSSHQAGRFTCDSPFTRSDLDAELSPLLEPEAGPVPQLGVGLTAEQVAVLSTLMDLQRQINAVQEKIKPSDEQTRALIRWNSSMVLEALHRPDDTDKSVWVFSFPITTFIPIQEWDLENIQNVIHSLVELGLLTRINDADFAFSEPMLKIVEHFTVFGKLFWLSIRRDSEGMDDFQASEEEHIGYCSQGLNLVFSTVEIGKFLLRTLSRNRVTELIAQEIFPAILPEVQSQRVPVNSKTGVPASIGQAAVPVQKKTRSNEYIIGLVALVVVACIVMSFGVVLLRLYYR
jgi:hypothetical protein